MEKIFEHADDLHVVARKIYINQPDDYVYSDREMTQKIDAKTLIDLFVKGVIVVIGVVGNGVFIKPFSCINDEDFTEIVCQDFLGGAFFSLYSKEYVKPVRPEE